MLKQLVQESPHKSFKVFKLCNTVAIVEANVKDRYNWGNGTEEEPAFLAYLGCTKDEVAGYIKTFNIFYRCDQCEDRKPKYLKNCEVEIKIRGMQRESDYHAFGLNYLLASETVKHPTNFNIDLDFCIADMADNFIYARKEYEELPPSIVQSSMFEAISEFLENFHSSPEKYVSDRIIKNLDRELAEHTTA